jgi:hypothetical protein
MDGISDNQKEKNIRLSKSNITCSLSYVESIEWQQCEIGTISGWIYMEEGGWKETIFRGHMVKVFYTHECKRTTKPAQFVPRG